MKVTRLCDWRYRFCTEPPLEMCLLRAVNYAPKERTRVLVPERSALYLPSCVILGKLFSIAEP